MLKGITVIQDLHSSSRDCTRTHFSPANGNRACIWTTGAGRQDEETHTSWNEAAFALAGALARRDAQTVRVHDDTYDQPEEYTRREGLPFLRIRRASPNGSAEQLLPEELVQLLSQMERLPVVELDF